MIDLGKHAIFIIAAYLGVLVTTTALIGAVVLNGRAKRKKLESLESNRKSGVRA